MDFGRLSQNVGSNIQKISSQISDIERMVRQIGTASDSQALRDRLHNQTHMIHDIAKQTGGFLKEIDTLSQSPDAIEQRQRKLVKEKLVKDFTGVLNRFQAVQREAANKEKASVAKARANSSNQAWNPFEDEGTRPSAATTGFPQTQTTVQVVQDDVDLQALRERDEAIRKLEADITDVNQIFKDLAVLVHDQGEIIDSIEANVDNAQVNVQHATSQLAQARNYQSQSRRKKILLSVILLVLLLVIILSAALSR